MNRGQIWHRMKAKWLILSLHRHPIFDPNFELIQRGNLVRILLKPRDSLYHQSRMLRRLLDEGLRSDEAILVLE